MRFAVLGSLLLLASLQPVLTAPTSEGGAATSEQAPETSSRPEPEPTTTTPRTTSRPTPTETSSSEQATTSSASVPTGGGQSCVQSCMALAASDSGCNGFTDSQCVCASSGFLDDAQQCFTAQNCDPAAVTGAIRAYSSVCRNLSASSDTTSTTDTSSSTTSWPTATVPPTPPPSRSVPDRTATVLETFVIQSGAVITVSGSVYTAGSAITTTFSGQFGDFAGGAGVGTLGANDGGASGTARPNSGVLPLVVGRTLPVTAMTLAVGVLIGGLTCLAF
ncbi:hypothetical protein FRC08_012301 [Ceratobasidium sp. 394]|nr:hypothetical protein FRC08_012301 [Ceratobasidium sp. 394]